MQSSMMPPAKYKYFMWIIVIPVMKLHSLGKFTMSPFKKSSGLPFTVCLCMLLSFIQSFPLSTTALTFSFNKILVFDVFHVFGMDIFLGTFLTFIKVSISHLRMRIKGF